MSVVLLVGAALSGLLTGSLSSAVVGSSVERRVVARRRVWIALVTAVAFLAVAMRFGWSWTLPAEIVLVAGLIPLSVIDFDRLLLPRVVVYWVGGLTGAAILLGAALSGGWGRVEVAAICAVVEFAVLLGVHLVSPRSLGFGDVRLGPVIALGLGWVGWKYAFGAFLAGNLIAVVVGAGLILARRIGRNTPIPFGVFLSLGALIALLIPVRG